MSWYREKSVKATRKPHTCEGCQRQIAAGSSALYVSCLSASSDGAFYGHFHADCREAECALNTRHPCYFDDEWLPLHEIDDEDRDWLLAKFPAVADRFLAPRKPSPDLTCAAVGAA